MISGVAPGTQLASNNGKALAVLGKLIERDGEPRRRAVLRKVVEPYVPLIRQHHVLRLQLHLQARPEEVAPREIEHHVAVDHVDHDTPLRPVRADRPPRLLPVRDDSEGVPK
jgi:hypothetical protein